MKRQRGNESGAVMTKNVADREEFLVILARELPNASWSVISDLGHKLMRASTTLHRIAELECSSEAADRDRVPCPGIHREADCLCDRYPDGIQHNDVTRISIKGQRTEYRVTNLLKPFGIVPVFQGDPRGAVLKLKMPSGKTNGWGNEGVCVP